MKKLLVLISIVMSFSVIGNDAMMPPSAKKDPKTFQEHGHVRTDNYHWLNQRDNPDVLAYLNAENTHTERQMAKTVNLQKELATEFKNRIKEDDSTVPYRKGNYFYYSRTQNNKPYPIYCRKRDSLSNVEEIILDVNELAKGHDFYQVGSFNVSPNEKYVAFSQDTVGRRQYQIQIKDLTTHKTFSDAISNTNGSMQWANDSKTLFYTVNDPQTLRSYRIFKHKLNQAGSKDTLIYEEKDDAFDCAITKTKSDKFLLIASIKTDTSEYQFLDADRPDEAFSVFSPREAGLQYYIDHANDKFFIRTNDHAPNFKLMTCALDQTAHRYWQPYTTYNDKNHLTDFEVFDKFLVLAERREGMSQIIIHPLDGATSFPVEFSEPDFDAAIVPGHEMATNQVRLSFSSLKTPRQVLDYDIKTRQKTLKKQYEVLGGFDSNNYETKRVFATAKDGVLVPISVVYRKDKFVPGKNPLLLEGYGSYGISNDPHFDPYVVSLLDRGFVYAIAHIRGGGELGQQWYFAGKYLKKKNTFTDFIDAAHYLSKQGYGAKDQLFAIGGSAGGLLMGAVINMQPDLFKGVVAAVPFVDVINTMLDPSIPLTTSEYTEWGNPNEKQYYEYMLSYSPYDNIQATAYPNLLVTAGYHDSQVQYWEAAKWVAKLRDVTKGDQMILLKTNMKAGHGGSSGRYERYNEKAFEYAYLLELAKFQKA